MNVREWALILFTVLAQMSVGAFVVLGVMHYFTMRRVALPARAQKGSNISAFVAPGVMGELTLSKAGEEEVDRLIDRALPAIGVTLGLGLLASLFHLGSPFKAYSAVANVSASWLSREILFGVLFAGLGFAFTFLQWRKIGAFAMRNALAWAAALVGLALVYSMANVYMLDTHPAWNTLATPILFFATTFLLGSLAVGSALLFSYFTMKRKEPSCAAELCAVLQSTVHWIAIASMVLLGVELVVIPIQLMLLTGSPAPEAVQSVAMMYEPYGVWFALRLVLGFLGAGLFALFIYRMRLSPGQEQVMGRIVFSAFALVLVAEVIGRFIFYATSVQIGI